MDATGFNRDEIEPDMDLRRDLSIRSSRLPVIMDAAERQFGITIELEDFIHVRTVKDIAQRISEIIARQVGAGLRAVAQAVDPGPERAEILKPSPDEASLKRLVFHQAQVEPAASIPMELSPGESVLLLSPDRDDRLAGSVEDILRLDYGVETVPMLFMPENLGPGVESYNLLTDAGSFGAAERISGLASFAGMVITLPQGGSARLSDPADVARLLRGLFWRPEGISPIAEQEIRRADPFQGRYPNSRWADSGGDARTVSVRRPGTPIGPVSHLGNRPRYRPAPPPSAGLWTEATPWWR